MSPEGSPYSSPRMRNSDSLSNSILPVVEVQQIRTSKADVRDVQVDDQVSLSKWSKKTRTRIPGRKSGSEMVDDWKRKALEVRSADWEVSEMTKNLSKVKREEAKITAWENLQKAKAEASIRKLEMKLEKKRSSSMDKIMNKLRSAQKKAQDMRGSVLSNHSQQLSRSSSQKAISLIRTPQIGLPIKAWTPNTFRKIASLWELDAWFPNFQEDDQDDLSSDGESQEGDVANKADNNESDVDRVSESSFMHENDTI
ncbi:remorin family protein [Tanacetum coccineum]